MNKPGLLSILGVCVFLATTLMAQVNYLIIYPDSLHNSAIQLKNYRESTGYVVDIVNLSAISSANPSTSEVIDSWIENCIISNTNLKYIVLLGNTDLIPTYFSSYNGVLFDSDLWYSVQNDSMNSNYLPNISIGRIPIANSEQASNYFNKIQYYESNSNGYNTILFYGNSIEMSYALNRDMDIAANFGFDTTSLIDPTQAELLNILNTEPIKAVIYYGHGSIVGNAPLYIYDLINWNNAQNPVLFFSGGCNFNDNTQGVTPFGDSLVVSPNGSVCSIGCSISGGYGSGYTFIKGILMNIRLYLSLGYIYNSALLYQYECSQDTSIGSWCYYFTRRMNFIGDPGLIINSTVTTVSDITKSLPDQYQLGQNYPNPFNPLTKFEYAVNTLGDIRIDIFNQAGQLVKTLENGTMDPGYYQATWDGKSSSGINVPSGIYFYRLVSGDNVKTKKMILLK